MIDYYKCIENIIGFNKKYAQRDKNGVMSKSTQFDMKKNEYFLKVATPYIRDVIKERGAAFFSLTPQQQENIIKIKLANNGVSYNNDMAMSMWRIIISAQSEYETPAKK